MLWSLTPGHLEPIVPVLLTLIPPPWHVEIQKSSLNFPVSSTRGKSNGPSLGRLECLTRHLPERLWVGDLQFY